MTAQTTLDLDIPRTPTKTRTYRIQKYRLSYTREPGYRESIAIVRKADAVEACAAHLKNLPIEKFMVIAMDNQNRIIGYTAIEGATNQCQVYPAQVFSFLFSAAATAFIIAHNHPGGNPRPSEHDWQITERLYKAGKLLDIMLLDHIIVPEDNGAESLREQPRWPK